MTPTDICLLIGLFGVTLSAWFGLRRCDMMSERIDYLEHLASVSWTRLDSHSERLSRLEGKRDEETKP